MHAYTILLHSQKGRDRRVWVKDMGVGVLNQPNSSAYVEQRGGHVKTCALFLARGIQEIENTIHAFKPNHSCHFIIIPHLISFFKIHFSVSKCFLILLLRCHSLPDGIQTESKTDRKHCFGNVFHLKENHEDNALDFTIDLKVSRKGVVIFSLSNCLHL